MRIALLGCGAIGELVARHVYARPDAPARVVAAVDARPERARAVADRLGAQAFTRLADALDGVDAVDVRLPHHLHVAAALEALAAGKHVLGEEGRRDLAVVLAAQRSLEAGGRVVALSPGNSQGVHGRR
jgi:predicted dehydrogenase